MENLEHMSEDYQPLERYEQYHLNPNYKALSLAIFRQALQDAHRVHTSLVRRCDALRWLVNDGHEYLADYIGIELEPAEYIRLVLTDNKQLEMEEV